ncbi:hypothetical protein [Streptomyces sp. NPDC089919]|uniref:hypothetical protein n=1 Tax=Streptomyces sp. NPDC089919 TaxID=3155188 RepID=UPI003429D7DA
MKHTRLSATGAAAVIAAGIAVGAATPATAAPAKPERITSTAQLHASLAKAVLQEQTATGVLGGGVVGRVSTARLSGDPVGQKAVPAVLSEVPVGRAASPAVSEHTHAVALKGMSTTSGTHAPTC